MNFDGIWKRIAELEPVPIDLGPWPPDKEDSLAHILWEEIGKPKERMTFLDMLDTQAKRVWQSESEVRE